MQCLNAHFHGLCITLYWTGFLVILFFLEGMLKKISTVFVASSMLCIALILQTLIAQNLRHLKYGENTVL